MAGSNCLNCPLYKPIDIPATIEFISKNVFKGPKFQVLNATPFGTQSVCGWRVEFLVHPETLNIPNETRKLKEIIERCVAEPVTMGELARIYSQNGPHRWEIELVAKCSHLDHFRNYEYLENNDRFRDNLSPFPVYVDSENENAEVSDDAEVGSDAEEVAEVSEAEVGSDAEEIAEDPEAEVGSDAEEVAEAPEESPTSENEDCAE